MKIDTIKNKYKNQWVLVDVTKENELNEPVEGKVLARSKDRDKIYGKIKNLPEGFKVATFYTGKVPPTGLAFAF